MASAKFYQKPTPKANGECPVYLRIIIHKVSKLIKMDYTCKLTQWDKAKGQFKKSCPDHQNKNHFLNFQMAKALEVFKELESNGQEITFAAFNKRFSLHGKKKRTSNVYDRFQEKIAELKESSLIGNMRVYDETSKSFFKFTNNNKLTFSDLDLALLQKYEVHLRSKGATEGGISVRMRTLRALYNGAIDLGLAKLESYPFRKYKISKLKGAGIKKALTRAEVQKIIDIDIKQYPKLTNARHWFAFSYFTRGMNFVDMMHLEWKDIDKDRISYTRAKTGSNFTVKILEPVAEILTYYKSFTTLKYVFPIILKEGLEANQLENRKKRVLKQFNKELKEIASLVGIDKPLTSYVARHSFATNLKHAGVSTSVISESLGHQNEQVTETYLKSFEDNIIDDAMEKLL